MKTKSALSYFGSDSEVASHLAMMLNECSHVTIAFAGGLSILPHLTARSIVANDLNLHAINFYRVLAGVLGEDLQQRLIARCHNTLSHPDEMLRAAIELQHSDDHSETAWAYWAMCWIGRKGKGGTKNLGGLPSVRRTANGGSNASRLVAAAADLEAWAKHFRRCEWEQVCFRELLPKVADQHGCGLYVDAPWVNAGKSYLHSFSEQDHRDLARLLDRFTETKIVIRYDDTKLVRELYPQSTWEWIEATSRTQANSIINEVWITR